jgi:hypothetical protein
MAEPPKVQIGFSAAAAETCAVCGRDWPKSDLATAYTVETIESDEPSAPVCDHCIESEYPPGALASLLAERQHARESAD